MKREREDKTHEREESKAERLKEYGPPKRKEKKSKRKAR